MKKAYKVIFYFESHPPVIWSEYEGTEKMTNGAKPKWRVTCNAQSWLSTAAPNMTNSIRFCKK